MAPIDVVYKNGKVRLLHYRGNDPSDRIPQDAAAKKHPLLIIYAPINTFHILDLNPRRSVVRNLLASGALDIYLLDWGYPDWSDDHVSLEDYLGHIHGCVKVIRDQTGVARMSIPGYCWGGIYSLTYTALHNDDIQDLILMAAPVDFSKDDTILARWARKMDVDKMMDEFGHMDGQILNLGFLMRNPPRYAFDKYITFFSEAVRQRVCGDICRC